MSVVAGVLSKLNNSLLGEAPPELVSLDQHRSDVARLQALRDNFQYIFAKIFKSNIVLLWKLSIDETTGR